MKKIIFFVAVALLSLSATTPLKSEIPELRNLSISLSQDFAAKNPKQLFKKNLAIFSFQNTNQELKEYNVGATVANMLSAIMNDSLLFTLIERENMQTMMKEIEFGETGLVNPDSAARIGKIAGAEYFIIGSVSSNADTITINAKLIQVESGEIIASRNATVPKSELISQAREQYFDSFQSRYGIGLGVNLSHLKPEETQRGLNIYSVDATYRFTRSLRAGIGFFYMDGNEIWRDREIISVTGWESYRNYDFSGYGPKLSVDGVYPVHPWLNVTVGIDLYVISGGQMTQDISDIQVSYLDPYGNPQTVNERVLINCWDDHPVFMGSLRIGADILLSKRVSLSILGGYMISQDYVPFVYEANGVRHWGETIDGNGTFAQYNNFNFSRKEDGSRVKVNFSGFLITAAVTMHF